MAEVGFYAPSGEKLVGEIIGTEGSYGNSGDDKYKLFDGDPLTYFNCPAGIPLLGRHGFRPASDPG